MGILGKLFKKKSSSQVSCIYVALRNVLRTFGNPGHVRLINVNGKVFASFDK